MNINAINDTTGETVTVTPVALQDIPGYDEYSALSIHDLTTGSPLYLDQSRQWHLLPSDEGYGISDAEHVTEIYGEEESVWEREADEALDWYGFKLGRYVCRFDFTVDGYHYDGYMLEAA